MKLNSIFYALTLALLTSTAYAQVKIGSNPGTIGATSNLEVEAANGNKTSVNKSTGQVTIQDGTQGAAKILTSDANGGASWQTLTQQNIPIVVLIGAQSGAYTVTPRTVIGINGYGQPKDRIPLTIRPGSYSGYDASTKQYTIQESAYYRVYAGSKFKGASSTAPYSGTSVRLYLYPFGVLQQYDDINVFTGPVLSVFWEGFLNAGTVLSVAGYVFESQVSNGNSALPLDNVIATEAFMSVTKLF
ncbi:hypothetical protein IC229_00870 [Spirosoma sp. BT702]|uniref:Uncharacterized protein n=1 Tax=Spirosoma profusum TaxID=2771354 RepID=A0A926XWW0_9BACT|nr:hypothetical protein [Spirosoma profusum]MBD2699168.1 hypothetical protein [Spirosoma profusum]